MIGADSFLGPVYEGEGLSFGQLDFSSVKSVLQIYCGALTGKRVDMSSGILDVSGGNLDAKSLQSSWFGQLVSGDTPDGHFSVTVPATFTGYENDKENFNWYKAIITQQLGHIEFGSFDFKFDRNSTLFENLRPTMTGKDNKKSASDIERYLNLFGGRMLASRVFAAVENVRVNYLVKYYYPGIRRNYLRMQENSFSALSRLSGLTLRRAFCELLEGLEINATPPVNVDAIRGPLDEARNILNRLCSPQATVEDAAEAAIRIYEIAMKIPKNLIVSSAGGHVLENRAADFSELESDDIMYSYNTVAIKKVVKAAKPVNAAQSIKPLTLTQAEMEKMAEKVFSTPDAAPPDVPYFRTFAPVQLDRVLLDKRRMIDVRATVKRQPGEKLYFYDEWDFRAKRYLSEWCCIHEKVLGEGTTTFYENTLRNHMALATDVRHQFEKLPTHMLYKARNLEDGDEYDLDQVINKMIEKKAGHTPEWKVYSKKQRMQRDVSVAFLLDLSFSTSDLIEKSGSKHCPRIIDVEKESLVLLMHAIEKLGDACGIFGFSGLGHLRVQFMVVKDLNERFSESVRRRLEKMEPIGTTRMGPAIRHTAAKLHARGSELKLLFLVSDGCPEDWMYGYNNTDRDYAINDTKMALVEAVRKDIIPFCLTVDSKGNDYMRAMCCDIGYEVLDNVELLRQRLPLLYTKLRG